MPLILARFWQVLSIEKKKIALKNQWLPDRTYTNIFVTSAPRASFWPSLAKFHFWLFPGLGDSYAELVLKRVRVFSPSLSIDLSARSEWLSLVYDIGAKTQEFDRPLSRQTKVLTDVGARGFG